MSAAFTVGIEELFGTTSTTDVESMLPYDKVFLNMPASAVHPDPERVSPVTCVIVIDP
jgi:hypothetical protein